MMNIEELKNIEWSKSNSIKFKELLSSLGDSSYREYNEKVIPNIEQNFGVKIPTLRKISKALIKNKNIDKIYNYLEDQDSYEEKIIQGMILPNLKYTDNKELFNNIDLYILRISNWAVCDNFVVSLREVIKSNKESFFLRIKKYIRSNNSWEIRFGLVLLNNYFADEKHIKEIFLMISYVKCKAHYVNTAIGWLISTCYFVDKELTMNFIQNDKITKVCVNKSLKKIIQSKKIKEDEKIKLKKLKEKYL